MDCLSWGGQAIGARYYATQRDQWIKFDLIIWNTRRNGMPKVFVAYALDALKNCDIEFITVFDTNNIQA